MQAFVLGVLPDGDDIPGVDFFIAELPVLDVKIKPANGAVHGVLGDFDPGTQKPPIDKVGQGGCVVSIIVTGDGRYLAQYVVGLLVHQRGVLVVFDDDVRQADKLNRLAFVISPQALLLVYIMVAFVVVDAQEGVLLGLGVFPLLQLIDQVAF